MSVGLSFIKTLLAQKSTKSFLSDFNLKVDYFPTDEQTYVKYISQFVSRYDRLPSLKNLSKKFDIEFPAIPKEPLQYWADEVRQDHIGRMLRHAMNEAKDHLAKRDVNAALTQIKAISADLIDTETNFGLHKLSDAGIEIIKDHDKRQREPKVNFTYGIPYLDNITDGLQPGDTTAIVGKTSMGKSFLLFRMANALHDDGGIPLVVSMEMPYKQVTRRCVALSTHVNESRIRKGQLNTLIGRKKVSKHVLDLGKRQPFYILDGIMAYQLEDLLLQIRNLNPDVVYIDGAYLIRTRERARSKWEGIADAAEQVKMIAAVTEKPIIGTYQFNKQGGIFGGDSVSFAASVIMYLFPDEKGYDKISWGKNVDTKLLVIQKGRGGEKGCIRLLYDMQRMRIEQHEVVTRVRVTEEK